MALTDSLLDFSTALYDKFVGLKATLGLEDVFKGDQILIPRSPALCVEPAPKTRDLQGALRRTRNVFETYLIVYHSEIRSPQENLFDAIDLAEQVENYVHLDKTLGGIVTHCFCTQVIPSYTRKSGVMFRTCGVLVQGTTTTNLP